MAEEYIEGYGPKPGTPLSPLAPGTQGSQGIEFFELPNQESKSPVTAQTGGLVGPLKQAYEASNKFLAGARAATTRKMTEVEGQPVMGPGGKIAAELLNPVPGNVFQAGMQATGPLAGTIAKGSLGRAAVTGGVDALLGAAEGGPVGAAMGGIGGALAGAGAGGVSKLGQPGKGFQALTKTKEMGTKYGSPEVQAWLRTMQEQELTRGSALKGLQDAASSGIEKIIGHVKTTLPENQMVSVSGLDPRIVSQYNASQTATANHISAMEGMFGQSGVAGTFENMDKFRVWLRGRNDPSWRAVMDEMINTADQHAGTMAGTPAGQAYQVAIKQYRLDKRLMDLVEGIQDIRSKSIIGGLNPTDFPEAKEITDLALKSKSQRALGAAEVAVGAGHPGMFGSMHVMRGTKKLLGGSGKNPIENVKPAPGPLKKAVAETAAGVTGALPGVPRLSGDDEE